MPTVTNMHYVRGLELPGYELPTPAPRATHLLFQLDGEELMAHPFDQPAALIQGVVYVRGTNGTPRDDLMGFVTKPNGSRYFGVDHAELAEAVGRIATEAGAEVGPA